MQNPVLTARQALVQSWGKEERSRNSDTGSFGLVVAPWWQAAPPTTLHVKIGGDVRKKEPECAPKEEAASHHSLATPRLWPPPSHLAPTRCPDPTKG